MTTYQAAHEHVYDKPHPQYEVCCLVCGYSPDAQGAAGCRTQPPEVGLPERAALPSAAVFICTEDDMGAGGYGPLKRDHSLDRVPTPEESKLLAALSKARDGLKALGWNDAMYAPRGGDPFLVIEPGSTGVHVAIRDEHGFWIIDGDMWPSTPMLWRPDR